MVSAGMGTVTRRRGILTALAALLFLGWNSVPPPPPSLNGLAKSPRIQTDLATGTQSTELSVLTYNVADLPWPIRSGRGEALRRIGEQLARLREEGRAPDIVLLQEAFTEKSRLIAGIAGYPNLAEGPQADHHAGRLGRGEAQDFVANRSFWKGERLGKVLGSGLMVLSNYPVVEVYRTSFRRRACAGFDCLANKGVLMAAIQIPGVPEPVDVLTTHMNSKRSSGVPRPRYTRAHYFQAQDVRAHFSSGPQKEGRALIAAGDFNTKGDQERLDYLTGGDLSPIVRYACRNRAHCDFRLSPRSPRPWLETQDLQTFFSGSRITVEPVRAELMFHEPLEGQMLSDHDGYLVTYRLSWPLGGEEAPFSVAAR